MRTSNKKIFFRVFSPYNSDHITSDFVEKINKQALQYLLDNGINAKLLPPPELGGGFDLSLLYKIIQNLIKVWHFMISFLNKMSEAEVDESAPLFKIYFYSDDSCKSVIWDWDDEVGNCAKELVFHNWQLIDFLKTRYPHYQFSGDINLAIAGFNYKLNIIFSYQKTNKVSIGQLIKFVKELQLKANASEEIFFSNQVFIKQKLSYINKKSGKSTTKNFFYLKSSKTRQFSYNSRGIKAVKTPKGIAIEPSLTN